MIQKVSTASASHTVKQIAKLPMTSAVKDEDQMPN